MVHTVASTSKNTFFRPKSLISNATATMTTLGAFTKHNSISDAYADNS